MLILVIAAWLAGIAVSFGNGNLKLPTTILLLGIGLVIAAFQGLPSHFSFAGIALLAAIIWIANKADDMR